MQQYKLQFEEACAKLGRSAQLPDVTGKTDIQANREIACHMADAIIDAKNMEANGGKPWVADLGNTTQEKWHPLFNIIKDETAPRGFRLSCHGCFFDYGYALLGARHACINRQVAKDMGQNFPDLYKDIRS